MDVYSFLRELADSWVLLILTLFFLGVWAWAFRPGSRPIHDDAAQVPFRHDEAPDDPAAPDPSAPEAGCGEGCPGCTCAPLDFLKEYRDV